MTAASSGEGNLGRCGNRSCGISCSVGSRLRELWSPGRFCVRDGRRDGFGLPIDDCHIDVDDNHGDEDVVFVDGDGAVTVWRSRGVNPYRASRSMIFDRSDYSAVCGDIWRWVVWGRCSAMRRRRRDRNRLGDCSLIQACAHNVDVLCVHTSRDKGKEDGKCWNARELHCVENERSSNMRVEEE
jgi:hypothetical protein